MSFNSNHTHNSNNTASTASPNASLRERSAADVYESVNLVSNSMSSDSGSMLNDNKDNVAESSKNNKSNYNKNNEQSSNKTKPNTVANASFFSRIPTQHSFTVSEPFPIDVVASQYNYAMSHATKTNTSNNNNENNNDNIDANENADATLNTSKANRPTPYRPLRSPERPSPRKARKMFSVSRGLTKAPRLLGRRIKHFFRDDLQMEVHFRQMPPRVITRELATLEVLAIYHRWLRGVQAFLAIIATLLSLLTLPNSQTFVNTAICILSIATCLLIGKVYHVKAQLIGTTNVLFAHRNVLTSPLLPQMLLEMCINLIMTPPLLFFWRHFWELLDYFVFLRLYAVVLYLNNALYVYRTFCRAMSAMSDLPLSTSFLIRAALIYSPGKVIAPVVLCWWVMLGCMFAHAEQINVSDGLWFAFQTLSTIGYGDITPITFAGQLITAMSYVSTVILIAYLIVLVHGALSHNTLYIHNIQTLFYCHDLIHSLRGHCAQSIQIAWRFHKLRQHNLLRVPTIKRKVQLLWMSWRLTRKIAETRHIRHALQSAEQRFQEPQTGIIVAAAEVLASSSASAASASPSSNELSHFQLRRINEQTLQRAYERQRRHDIEALVHALQNIDRPACSLSREEITQILFLHHSPSHKNNNTVTRYSYAQQQLTSSRIANSFECKSLEADQTINPLSDNEQRTGKVEHADTPQLPDLAAWKQRVSVLEKKCEQLSDVIDALVNAVE